MGYSVESTTANCYAGTTCLINKFGIKNEQTLAQIEADITFAKAAILESEDIHIPLDFNYYKYIHRFLFEDLYDWAGKLRTIDISKKGTSFCPAKQLETLCENCFKRLVDNDYFSGLDRSKFIEEVVDFYVTTNTLHPFREGNGRTQRIFISKLIKYNGFDFDFSNINHDELMSATIHSANGVNDYLIGIFDKEIR